MSTAQTVEGCRGDRLLASLRWFSRLKIAVAATLLLACCSVLSSCLRDDIGLSCDLSQDQEEDKEKHTRINFQAQDCEDRICASYETGASGPRCTGVCETDDDCPTEGVADCEKFVCRIGQTSGHVACCKFCFCAADAKNPEAEDELEATCRQVDSIQCPDL